MKVYRHTRFMRMANGVISTLLRLGLPMGPMALLTVPGRESRLPRSTPVALAVENGGWRLGAPYGPVDWVKNLRKAGEAIITIRGRQVRVVATELTPVEAAPHLRQALAEVNRSTRRVLSPYFDTQVDAPLEAWMAEATLHPMFRLVPKHGRDPDPVA